MVKTHPVAARSLARIKSTVWQGIGVLGFVLLLGILPAATANAEPLLAGVSVTDITPPAGLTMYGYFPRIEKNVLSTGTLDPLYARVLVFAVGHQRLAFISLDLGRTFGPSLLDRLRQDAAARDHVADLVITASHTHAGPNILDEYPPGQTPQWQIADLKKIETAIGIACQNLAPARIGVDYGSVSIGYNRRLTNPDGTVRMLWDNFTKIPTAPVDPTVGVMRIDNMDGSPMAILVNYACHPVVFGEDNLQYSADFPGVMTKAVEKAFGGKAVCMFLQGAAGDIDPYDAAVPLVNGAIKYRDWTGEQLAREAIDVARGIQTKADSAATLQFAEDVLPVAVRWNAEKFRDGLLKAYGPKIFEDHADLFAHTAPAVLNLAVTTVLIDRQIAFVGLPGEPFVDFQLAWRAQCPVHDAFFLGYTNGYFDYFPTIRAASEGGYGAGDSNTYVAVGAGERMVRHGLMRIYGMLGKWSELPEDITSH